MLILLLKVRSLHYLLIILLVASKNLRLVTFAIFAGQCKYSMGTRLSPPIMLVNYVQKLVLILIVIIFKPSTADVLKYEEILKVN